MLTAFDLIAQYELAPHPEGGHYKQTYKSDELYSEQALPSHFGGDRAYSTAIYYLLSQGEKSHLHRIHSDEIWHFYLGGPLELTEIYPDGRVIKTVLGQNILRGQKVQCVVPAGVWFGAIPLPGTEFSFVGCTVAPGFEFEDFEMGKRETLLEQFPHAESEILRLTK